MTLKSRKGYEGPNHLIENSTTKDNGSNLGERMEFEQQLEKLQENFVNKKNV